MGNVIYTERLDGELLRLFNPESEVRLLRCNEPEPGLFLAESTKVIERALNAGYEPVAALFEQSKADSELISRLGDAPVYVCGKDVMDGATKSCVTGGAVCAMRRKPLLSPEAVTAGKRRIAVIEGVVNPTNVGAIFRSAAAMGIEAILLSPACSDPLYRRAIRVSMGNVFSVPWTFAARSEAEWVESGVETLHTLGFKTAALALRPDTVSIRDERLKREERLAILLGAEGDGLSDSTISRSDYVVKIPMTNGVDSLNVAAASAVAFWELAMNE